MINENLQSRIKCLGTFSNGNDVHFAARFSLDMNEDLNGGQTSGKIGNGYLINYNQHVRMVYKLMLSKSPIMLSCECFQVRIAFLSPRRFTVLVSDSALPTPHLVNICPTSLIRQPHPVRSNRNQLAG